MGWVVGKQLGMARTVFWLRNSHSHGPSREEFPMKRPANLA